MIRKIDQIWHRFRALQFEKSDLEELLATAHETLDSASFAGQIGRTLVHEKTLRRQLPIPLSEARSHPTTTRIDGVLPLLIPSCRHVGLLVEELLLEASRLGLRFPSADRMDRFREELSLVYFAFLHGREIQSSHRLMIAMQVECPHSAWGGQTVNLSLRGVLPLGGTVTFFTSNLRAEDWGDLAPGDVAHVNHLDARRDDLKRLRLVEVD